MHLEVFSDPVWGLGGRPGIRLDDGSRAVAYDEELIKPAILLADSVGLRTYRLDVQMQTQIDGGALRFGVPLAAQIRVFTTGRGGWITEAAGVDEILEDLKVVAAAHTGDDGRIEMSVTETDVAIEFSSRLFRFYKLAYEELSATRLAPLKASGILTELPWDSRDYSDFSVPRAMFENRENSFAVGFAELLEHVESGSSPLMIDHGIGDRLSAVRPGVPARSDQALGNAADLLRAVDAISEAPLDAVIDVRTELEPYIAPFRRFILSVVDDLEVPADASLGERHRMLQMKWETEVAPAVDELKAHVESNSFSRNLFRVTFEKAESTLAIGMGILGAIGADAIGFATLGGAAIGAAPLLAGVARASIEGRKDARQNPAYFIYELEKRLRARGIHN